MRTKCARETLCFIGSGSAEVQPPPQIPPAKPVGTRATSTKLPCYRIRPIFPSRDSSGGVSLTFTKNPIDFRLNIFYRDGSHGSVRGAAALATCSIVKSTLDRPMWWSIGA